MAFQAIAQGVGRAGNEYAQGVNDNLDRAIKVIQSKLEMQMLQQQMQAQELRMKQMQAPQPYGTVNLPGGGVEGLTFDPSTGKYSTQPIAGTQYDKEGVKKILTDAREKAPKEYQQAIDLHLKMLDLGMETPEAAIKAVEGVTTAAAGKEYTAATRKQSVAWGKDAKGFFSVQVDPTTNQPKPETKSYTSESGLIPPSNLLTQVKQGFYTYTDNDGNVHQVPVTTTTSKSIPGAGAPPTAPSAAPATKLRGAAPPSAHPSVPAAGPQKDAFGGKIIGAKGRKLNADEMKMVDVAAQAVPLIDKSMAILDKVKNDNSLTSAGKMRLYWQMYQHGFQPPEFSDYFQYAALMRVQILGPYLHGIRNPKIVEQIQQHLPNPEMDTPKFAYEKMVRLKPLLQHAKDTLGEPTGTGGGPGAPPRVLVEGKDF